MLHVEKQFAMIRPRNNAVAGFHRCCVHVMSASWKGGIPSERRRMDSRTEFPKPMKNSLSRISLGIIKNVRKLQ